MSTSLSKLVELLKEGGLSPRLSVDNIVPHISYDHEYRIAIIAIVFGELAEAEGASRRIRYYHLSLYQFILLHPHLLGGLADWAAEYHHRSHNPLEEVWLFPNSFSSDSVFQQLYTYFVAFGYIQQNDDYSTIDPAGNRYFSDIFDHITQEGLFSNVIEVARSLRDIRIPKKVLAK